MRKTVAKPSRNFIDRLDRNRLLWAGLFIAVMTIVGGVLAIGGRQPRYRAGQVVTEPIVARVDFSLEDKDATARQREEVRRLQPNVFVANEPLFLKYQGLFRQIISDADRVIKAAQVEGGNADESMPLATALSLKPYIEPDGKPTAAWLALTREMNRKLFTLAILKSDVAEREKSREGLGAIVTIHPDAPSPSEHEQTRYRNKMFDIASDQALIEDQLTQFTMPFPREARSQIILRVLEYLEPTYHLDETLSEERRDEAARKVQDIQKPVNKNDVIVEALAPMSLDHVHALEAEQRAYESHVAVNRPYRAMLQTAGQIGFVLLLAGGLWCYIFAYSERLARNPMRGLAITGLLLLCQSLAVGGEALAPGTLYLSATFPTLMAAMILAIAYDQRFALAVGGMHTVLVMYSLNLPVGFAVVLLTGIAVAVGQLHEVRTRSKLVRVGMWTGGTMMIAAAITTLAESRFAWINLGFAAVSGVAVGMFVQGILPMIERAFKVTTSMTLKELNDASHPLLQRLAQAAPGTYQHSLRLADITEASADAIGANGLLCRVGAMYHDIGKMNKPAYFIENQGGGPNRHSKLSPAMSVLIIVGHVKDGIEMAREYGLPPVLRHFIETHHGTTLVEYFYHAAKQQREADDQPAPTEFEFRYPGPKPQTKEAAIMMLGDSVESACRALDEPTPARIEQLVHTIAQKRLMDGQFDECNLTLQELHRIETAMTKTLCAVYHSRIKYPGDKKAKGATNVPAGQVGDNRLQTDTPPAAASG